MKKLIKIIAISCMPFLSGVAVAADPGDGPYGRYNFDGGTGFERMGFGFAQPIITIIPGHTKTGGTAYRPVVIIAGGYDPTKDYIGAKGDAAAGDPDEMEGRGPTTATNKARHEDSVGNAIYFIDAMSGDLVARVRGTTALTPGTTAETVAEADTDVSHGDLDHSIPATVTIVDSQGDGVTDRIYFIDVIGNIWRLDLIPATDTTKIAEHWKLNKFASLGTEGAASGAYLTSDRRFFNQIDVVRTRMPGTNTNVDALLVGSGNIANPKGATVYGENKFFVIYDEHTQPTSATLETLTMVNLFNASAMDGDDNYLESDVQAGIESGSNGWYWDLEEDEKVVSAATTIEGAVYFTTIVAGPDDVGCQAPDALPASWIYGLNMHTAAKAYPKIIADGVVTEYERKHKLSSGLAFQQIDPFVSTEGDVSIIIEGEKKPVHDSDGKERKLEGAGSYWRTEDQ